MSHKSQLKICDPLYDYIYFDEGESQLIQHPLFQRLRSIRQMGFSGEAFPSGTHSRFAHSLGVCHLAGRAFDSIFEKNPDWLSEKKKQAFRSSVRMAALLHDIGHGPLSHSSEPLFPPLKSLGLEKFLKAKPGRPARHEDYSLKFILEKEALSPVIEKSGQNPRALATLLHPEFSGGEDFFKEGGLDFLPLLSQIISSDFDVDRMDYLHRDSLFCGVRYGLIDSPWLLDHFDVHVVEGQVFLAIRKEALYTLESLILGRQHMRMIVYFHYKSVIYNEMLKNYAKETSWKLPSEISEYLHWVDSYFLEKQIKSSDNIWARRIREQRPFLRLYERAFLENSPPAGEGGKALEDLKNSLKKQGLEFMDINSSEHAIQPQKSRGTHTIYLKNSALNQVQEFYKDPALLKISSRKIQRIYVEPSQFEKARSCLKSIEF